MTMLQSPTSFASPTIIFRFLFSDLFMYPNIFSLSAFSIDAKNFAEE